MDRPSDDVQRPTFLRRSRDLGPEVLAPRWAQSRWISFALSVPPARTSPARRAPASSALAFHHGSRMGGRVVKVILPGVKATQTSQNLIAIDPDEREAGSGDGLSWYLRTREPGVCQGNLRQFPKLEASSRKRVMEQVELWNE